MLLRMFVKIQDKLAIEWTVSLYQVIYITYVHIRCRTLLYAITRFIPSVQVSNRVSAAKNGLATSRVAVALLYNVNEKK